MSFSVCSWGCKWALIGKYLNRNELPWWGTEVLKQAVYLRVLLFYHLPITAGKYIAEADLRVVRLLWPKSSKGPKEVLRARGRGAALELLGSLWGGSILVSLSPEWGRKSWAE